MGGKSFDVMKKIGGFRRKTRSLFRKGMSEKGKISLQRYLQTFEKGDRVKLILESSLNKGIYHPMFYGKNGLISGKKGRCYEVLIMDGGKQKTLIVHPIHLKKE